MDGRTLMDIMQSPNFAMWGPAEQAFNTTQEKAKADLATTLGLEQRNQEMHPLEKESKRQAARMSGGQADIYADTLARKIPAEDERKAALQASIAKMDDTSRAQMKAQVVRNMQLAAMMKKNKGQLPEGFSLSPEEAPYFTPDKLDAHIAHGQAFLEMDPEEISKRQRAAEALKLEGVKAQGRVDLKATPAPGKGDIPATVPQTYGEVLAAMSKLKEARQKLAYLKSALGGMSKELQMQLIPTYTAIKAQADAEANARLAGQVDIAASTKGKVPVTPPVNLGDAPGAVTNRPARQAAGTRVTIYKDGKPVGTVPAEQAQQAVQQGYQIK